MNKTLQDMTIDELKVLAYDTIAFIESRQRFLKEINEEISIKAQAPKVEKKEEPKK
jgi:hypothetical protein